MGNHNATELYYTDKVTSLLQTMPPYVKNYIRAIHNRTASRTRYEYIKDIEQFLNYLKTKMKTDNVELEHLDKCNKVDFEEYFEYLEHYTANGKSRTNCRTSIKRKMSSLRRFFAYLFENNCISADQIRKVEIPKLHKKEIIHMETDETITFLNAVENGGALTKKQQDYHNIQSVRDTAIAHLLLSTGLRVSECSELDVGDIDMNKCSARIIRKGGSEAIVYFSDEAAKHLQDYLDTRPDIKNDEPLFLSSRKTRMGTRTIEILIKKYAMRSVPNKHITPHKLRATYATDLYNATGDIYLVAETLGHRDVSTTKEHYANMSEKHKAENRNKVTYKTKR